jgi:hypothetical protein
MGTRAGRGRAHQSAITGPTGWPNWFICGADVVIFSADYMDEGHHDILYTNIHCSDTKS